MRWTRPQRRSLASLVLAAWLFALAVGVANACIAAQAAAAAAPCQSSGVLGHGSDPTPPQPCAKFCNDNTPLPAKSLADDAIAAVVPMAAVAPVPVATTDAHGTTTAADRSRAPPGVPLYLRSLRLAL